MPKTSPKRSHHLLISLSALLLVAPQTVTVAWAEETAPESRQEAMLNPPQTQGETVFDPSMPPPTAPTRITRPSASSDLSPDSPANIDGEKPIESGSTAKNSQAGSAGAAAAKPAKTPPVHLSAQEPKLAPLTPKMAPVPGTTDGDKQATASNSKPADQSTNASPLDQSASQTALQPGQESYPTIGKLETMTFGAATPAVAIEQRLNKLETAVLKKTFPEDSLFDRTERLKRLLIGNSDEGGDGIDFSRMLPLPPTNGSDALTIGDTSGTSTVSGGPMVEYFDNLSLQPENQSEITRQEAEQYFVQLVNDEREKIGMSPLKVDATAAKLANDQVGELCQRNMISHSNSKGDNPDRRYTLQGGDGAVTESLVAVKRAELGSNKHTKASVCKMLKTLVSRQDDREALLAPEATDLGVGIDWTKDKDRVLGCVEVITKHGVVEPIATQFRVGDKAEIRGVVSQPFRFEKITVAWEGDHSGGSSSDESEEALPYFPPLDYVAYQQKSDHDYSGTLAALRTIGVVAAIAGGVFMPPVALAAPLIAMSGSMGNTDPKPASDIPVHGGVHVENGSVFSARVPINNSGKEGIYYITVWASLGKGSKVVPISRRAIIGKTESEDVQAQVEESSNDKKSPQ